MLPSYQGVRIFDHNDVDTIWRAYVNGIIQPISSEDIRCRSSLIESGNLVVYQGERYRDGEKWQKKSSSRDRIVVETNDNLQIKKKSVSFTSPSIRIISYVPLDEEKEKRIPRAVDIIESVALPEFGDPGIGRGMVLQTHPHSADLASVGMEDCQWTIYGELTAALSSFTSDPTILGDHPSFVNTQAKDHNFDDYCMFTQNDDVFPPHDIQRILSDMSFSDDNPDSDSSSSSANESIGPTSHPPYIFSRDKNPTGDLHQSGPWDRNDVGFASSSSTGMLPFTVFQCTKNNTGVLSATAVVERSSQHFEDFCRCVHTDDISPVVIDTFRFQQTRFLTCLMDVDSNNSRCFGATETFVIDYQGETKLLGCLAVVLPELDSVHISQTLPGGSVHFAVDFVLLPITTYREGVPSSWLETQLLGSHFPTERQKRAAWALGQLPPGSYHPGSSTFKCIHQYWYSVGLSSGSRHVVQLDSPGTSLSPLAHFKLSLYHPANASLASSLVSLLDEKLRKACEDCVEEWLIAVYEARRYPPERLDSMGLQKLYCEYMRNLFQLQADSFHKAGYADKVLHECAFPNCPHSKPSFRELQDELSQAFDCLVDGMTESIHVADFPSPILRKQARDLGLLLYWFQSSYILLQPHERELHDTYCRPQLNEMRATLRDRVFPAPALIWNYLPHNLQSRLQQLRLSQGVSAE